MASTAEPRHTGTLEKRPAGRFARKWTQVHARLTDQQLSFHKSETDLTPQQNPIQLQNLADDWDKHAYTGDDPRQLTLTMKESVSKKPFIFRAEDREDSTMIWIEKIRDAKQAGRSTAEIRRKKSRGTMVEALSPTTRKKTKLSVLRRGTRHNQLAEARERVREHREATERRYHPDAIMQDDFTDQQTLTSLEETALALLGDIDGDGVPDDLKRGEAVDILHGEHKQIYTAENPDAVVHEVVTEVGLVVVKVRGVCRIMPLHYVRRAISVMRANEIEEAQQDNLEQEAVDQLEANKKIHFKAAPDTFAEAPSIALLEADGKYRPSGVDIAKMARHNGMHGELKRKGMELRRCWYDNFFLLKLDCFELRFYKRKPASRQQTYDLLEGVILLTGAKIEMPQQKKKKKEIDNSFAIRAEMHHGEPRFKQERLISLRASGPEEFAQWMGGISYAIRCAEIKQDRLAEAAGANLQELKDVQKMQTDLLDKVKDWESTPTRQERSLSGRGATRGEIDVKDAVKKALQSGIKKFEESVPRQLEALVMSKGGELNREVLVDIAKAMQKGTYHPKDSHGRMQEEIALARRRKHYLKPYDNAFTIPEALEWLSQNAAFRKYCVPASKPTKSSYDEDDTDPEIGKSVIDELVDVEFIRHIRDKGGDDQAGQDKSRSFVGLYQLRMENVMDGIDQVLDKLTQTMTQGDLARMVRKMQDDAKLLKSQKMGSQSKCMRGRELRQWLVSDDNSDAVYWTTNQADVEDVKRPSQRHRRTGAERVYHVHLCDKDRGDMEDLLGAFDVHDDVQRECTGEVVAERIVDEMLAAVLLEPCNNAGRKLADVSFGSPSQLRKKRTRFAEAQYYLPGHNFDLLVKAGVEFSDERKTEFD